MSISKEEALGILKQYFASREDELKEDSSSLGAARVAQDALAYFKMDFAYRLTQRKAPNPDSEIAHFCNILLGILISDADADPVAFDALQLLVAELDGLSEFLPKFTRPQKLTIWLDEHPSRPRQHGPSRFKNWGRDLHIAWGILHLEQHGIRPTRNDAQPATNLQSGCDIARDALASIGIHLSFNAVRTIWDRFGNLK